MMTCTNSEKFDENLFSYHPKQLKVVEY